MFPPDLEERGAKPKASTARKNKKQPKRAQVRDKDMTLDRQSEEVQLAPSTNPTAMEPASFSATSPAVQPSPIPGSQAGDSHNVVPPMNTALDLPNAPILSPNIPVNSTTMPIDCSTTDTIMDGAITPTRVADWSGPYTATATPTFEPVAQVEDNFLPRGQFTQGLIKSLLALKKKANRQEEKWEENPAGKAGVSEKESAKPSAPGPSVHASREALNSPVSQSTPLGFQGESVVTNFGDLLDDRPHVLPPTRPTKTLPTRGLIPQVIITKRPPAKATSLHTAFISASLLPRDQDSTLPPFNKKSLFTPRNSDGEDDGVSRAQSEGEDDIPQQVPVKPFNKFRVATEDELPPSDQPVPIQLGRPKLPDMDMSPYRITSSAARVVPCPDGYRINGFEPFFSFYHENLDRFLLIPRTHHVTGWPMYPGSYRALAREWEEIESALEEHASTQKRKQHLESPLQRQAKKPGQVSPPSSPLLPTPQDVHDSPDQCFDESSETASNYSTTQKTRQLQGRDYSLSGSDDEGVSQQSSAKSRTSYQMEDTPTPTTAPTTDKCKGKARPPSPGPSTEHLLLSEETLGLASDVIETLMAIAVDHDTTFPAIFAAVGVDTSNFFPPLSMGEYGKCLGRPRYDNPFNIWLPYYRVVLDKQGRKVPFAEFSAEASLHYAPFKNMTESERAPHVEKWVTAVIDHARTSGGKKPALMKYHTEDAVKQLEMAIADVQSMGCNICNYGDHIHFTAAVFSTDVVAQQGSVAMSSSPFFAPFVHQLGLQIRPQLNRMIAFTQACEHRLIILDTPPLTERGAIEVAIIADDDDDDDEESTSHLPLSIPNGTSPLQTPRPQEEHITKPPVNTFSQTKPKFSMMCSKKAVKLHSLKESGGIKIGRASSLALRIKMSSLSKGFLYDHYSGIKNRKPVVSFIAWPKEWRDIDPNDPMFNQLTLIQDEQGDVLHRVGNVPEWVNATANKKLSAEAAVLLASESIPPIDKARAKAQAFKTIRAVNRDTIRTEDVSKSIGLVAAAALVATICGHPIHLLVSTPLPMMDRLSKGPAVATGLSLATLALAIENSPNLTTSILVHVQVNRLRSNEAVGNCRSVGAAITLALPQALVRDPSVPLGLHLLNALHRHTAVLPQVTITDTTRPRHAGQKASSELCFGLLGSSNVAFRVDIPLCYSYNGH
ncbi:hypothetical protein BKA70DRAFT_1225327 [Coprinopsis sp. MPI-PUGE-AT-0042]|nr:hypothetical protein BKA70DRAFT_1225327 [Coprinopsis sp. MPI-PUGE-AT-0042]